MTNFRKFSDKKGGSFIPVNINGAQYDNYSAPYDQKYLFGKLAGQGAHGLEPAHLDGLAKDPARCKT